MKIKRQLRVPGLHFHFLRPRSENFVFIGSNYCEERGYIRRQRQLSPVTFPYCPSRVSVTRGGSVATSSKAYFDLRSLRLRWLNETRGDGPTTPAGPSDACGEVPSTAFTSDSTSFSPLRFVSTYYSAFSFQSNAPDGEHRSRQD